VDLKLHQLKPAKGAKKRKKILGHGYGSGHGGSSTRGVKGQGSRSGGGPRLGFEGGQMPLIRRIPKRGFTNPFRKNYTIVNLNTLEKHFSSGEIVTPEILKEKKIVKKNLPIKILAQGDLTKGLKIVAHAFSKGAEKKILASSGTLERINQSKS
jgi:large subunit ribosomal protein L15